MNHVLRLLAYSEFFNHVNLLTRRRFINLGLIECNRCIVKFALDRYGNAVFQKQALRVQQSHIFCFCSFDYTGFIKEMQGRWVDVNYFGEKIINCHCYLRGCGFKWMALIFFLVITRSLRMTLLICDTLGKLAEWTTPSNKRLGCISLEWMLGFLTSCTPIYSKAASSIFGGLLWDLKSP